MAQDIDTGTTDLLASLDEGVLTLTLNRPEAQTPCPAHDRRPGRPARRRRVQSRRQMHRADRAGKGSAPAAT